MNMTFFTVDAGVGIDPMHVDEIYRRWAARHYDVNVQHELIQRVEFSHYQNEHRYLEPDEFDTFNGCEMWSMVIYYTDGAEKFVNLWDCSPVGSIAAFANANGWTIEFDPPAEPTTEELIDMDLRRL